MKKSVNYSLAFVTAALAATSANAGVDAADRILGIDVSSGSGTINWPEVASNGVVFAYALATTGTAGTDSSFAYNMTQGKAAGIQMGAIQFSHLYADTPSQEANHFWNVADPYIKADGESIYPAIDFEVFSGHDGASSYTAWFNAWASDLKAKTAVFLHPVILASACAGACDLTTGIGLSGWIANYNGEDPYTGNPWNVCTACNAWDPNGTGGWTFWQFTDTGHVGGISGSVDLDVYNGNLSSLKSTQGVGGK
jgi:GH25 family lysozyme M1 (1,4-beta-N-acetylmuramidase)